MDHPGDFTTDVCRYLGNLGLMGVGIFDIPNAGAPTSWKKQCIRYIQYAAYNMPQREDYQFHFYYALTMEKLLQSIPEAAGLLPDDFSAPVSGNKKYTVASPELAPKPVDPLKF